jgi:hypothetical protein
MTTINGDGTNNMDNAHRFVCINDRGLQRPYHVGLFIEPEEEIIPEPEPIIIPDLTYDDVVAKLTYEIFITGDRDDHDDDNLICLNLGYNQGVLFDEQLSQWHRNDLSCGVIAITDIGEITDAICDLEINSFEIEDYNLILSEQDLVKLRKLIFKEFMTRLLINNELNLSYAFAMLSDNTDRNEIHWDVLDKMSITDVEKNERRNPNGGNQIKFWLIPLTFVRDEDDEEDEYDEEYDEGEDY